MGQQNEVKNKDSQKISKEKKLNVSFLKEY